MRVLFRSAQLKVIDPPSAAAVQEARVRLQSLEALDDDDRITAHGKAISRLPLEPRLAHMLVRAGDRDLGWMAAEVAVLVTERGLGGNDADLTQRLQRWRRETGKRRSEEHTSELQSLMRISYAVFCLKKKKYS